MLSVISVLRVRFAILLFLLASIVYFAGGPIAGAMQPVGFSADWTREESVVATMAMPPVTFGAGSLIIPMDTGTNGQNNGMLRAYGLVYELLRNNIPVNWVISPTKSANGDDFAIALASVVQDVRTGATVTTPRSYRGGPFVIAAADAAAALPFIQVWQAVPGDATAVHRLIGAGSISPNVSRVLVRAPRIAVLKDGNETIAFNNLNAAGITDSAGATWTAASTDLLTEAAVTGPTTSVHNDGSLFYTPGGLTRYGHLVSMHYNTTANTAEVVQETRSWLTASSLTSAFMQCESVRVFESTAAGLFLTTTGLDDVGGAPVTPTVRVPSDPLAQFDGTFSADTGSVDSIGLVAGSGFRPGVTTIINENASPLSQQILLLKGNIDGNPGLGKVTYLGGHDYALDLPITANPQTNGVRLFLNAIFDAGVATDAGQADVTITKSAPAFTNTNTIDYTINYSNPGPRPVENLKVVDTLPAGATYLAGSGVPAPTTNAGGILTWDLPQLASGAGASISFSVTVSTDGSYTNRASVQFSNLAVRSVSSNATVTTRDTVAPTVTITAGPSGPTNNTTPTFSFTTDASAVVKQCAIDNVGYTPCSPDPAQYTSAVLTEGSHTFYVKATDAAGNTTTSTRSFTVDATPPIVTIPGPPTNPTVTNDNTPDLLFTVIDNSTTTTQCQIDSGSFASCTSPFTVGVPLTDGPHSLLVRATDAAANVGSGTFNFVVNTSTISGTVTYGNAAAPPKYVLTGFSTGPYTVSLSKTTGVNGINSFDAARIAQHVAGTGPGSLTTNEQRISADVTNNGIINSFDAAKIAQYAASIPSSPNLSGTWRFFVPNPTFPLGTSPTSRTYSSVTSSITGDDYVGLLIGEVTGNWTPSSARPVGSRQLAEGNGPEKGIAVELPDVSVDAGKEVAIPVNVQGVSDKGLISYEFDLSYDPSVIQPVADVADAKGTSSRGLSVVTNATEPGLLRVVVYGALPIDDDGVLLNLRFTAVGAPGSASPLRFERIMFNEGEPSMATTDGHVSLLETTGV